MSENIRKIQSGLTGIIDSKLKVDFIKNFAHILIFASPVHALLYIIPYNSFLYGLLSWTDALCYVASIVGLLICFARNDMKKVGIYFILSAAPNILNLFRGYSFNISSLIYIAFYVFLGICALRYSGGTNNVFYTPTQATPVNSTPPAQTGTVCSKCGNQLKPGASFCGVCGTKVE